MLNYRLFAGNAAATITLTSITEYGSDGATALPPTKFTYDPSAGVYSPGPTRLTAVSMTGDPVETLGGGDFNGTVPTSPNSRCTHMMDMNADGLDDVLVGLEGNYYYYQNLGSNNFSAPIAIPNPPTALPHLCGSTTTFRRDYPATHSSFFGIGHFRVGRRGSFDTVVPVHNTTITDMDGDGYPDILHSTGVGLWFWWRNLGNGTFADRVAVSQGPADIQLSNTDVRLADMDGDGLVDIVQTLVTSRCGVKSTWDIKVYRNLGSDQTGVLRFSPVHTKSGLVLHVNDAFPPNQNSCVPQAPQPGVGMQADAIFFADMNRDGLPDLVWSSAAGSGSRIYYYPNEGAHGPTKWTSWGWSFGPMTGTSTGAVLPVGGLGNDTERLVDWNGDGLPDILVGRLAGYFYYQLSADGVYNPSPISIANPPPLSLRRVHGMALANMNGDGFLDIVSGYPGDYRYYTADMSKVHKKLTSAQNSFGGTQFFNYQRLRSGNTIRWVTNSVIESDMMGPQNTTRYNFEFGKNAGWPHNEFRGYGIASVIDPANNTTITYFYQDDARKGRVNSVVYNDSAGTLMRQDYNSYNAASPVPGVSRVDLGYSLVYSAPYGGTGGVKTKDTNYENYDLYGNSGLVTVSGSDIATRVTSTSFVYNTAAYIVNRPSHTVARIGSTAGTLISIAWFTYDGLAFGSAPTTGNLTREERWLSDGVNPVVRYDYDAVGNRIGTIDAKSNLCFATGYSNAIAYDATYRTFPVSETNALCQTTTKTYWGVNNTALASASVTGGFYVSGLPASVTDPNGVRSDSYWDVSGRAVASVIPPNTVALPTTFINYTDYSISSPSSKYEYQLWASTGRGYNVKITFFDGFGRTIQVKSETEGGWITQDLYYNDRGLVEFAYVPYFTLSGSYTPRADALKPRTATTYDALRRPTRVTNPDGTFRTTAYSGWSVTDTDEKGYTTTRNYDALQRLISVVEPAGGGATRYYYDSFNATNSHNFQFIVDAAGNQSQTEINTLGQTVSSHDLDRGWRVFTFDANGNMLTQTDNKAQTLTFAYDKLNRMTSKTYPDATKVTNSYDDATAGAYRIGRLWKTTDPSGSATFTFDQRGRQIKVDKAIGATIFTTQSTYDSLNRLVNLTYPDGEVVNHSYNLQGLLTKVRSTTYAQDYITNLNYNALGKVTAKTAGSGIVTNYDYYDAAIKGPTNFRLRNLRTLGLQNLTYAYDNAGNISSVTDNFKAATQTFGYDNLHRLTSASSTAAPAYTHTYTYDLIGNMTTGAGKTFAYPLATAARPHAPVSTSDGCSFYYDNNGNQVNSTCGTVAKYSLWDYDNRPTGFYDTTKWYGQYTYDYAGERVKKVEGAVTTLTPFPHYRTVNGAITRYYFANGERVAERISTAATDVFFYHSDHLGSSNTVSNTAGAEVKATLFYPYGSTRSESGSKSLAFQYTGQEKDAATGFYYYGARYYDPASMHFISADNIIPDYTDPQMLNRYAYVRNNPIRLVDPTGRAPTESLYAAMLPNKNSVLSMTVPIGRGTSGVFSLSAGGLYAGLGIGPPGIFYLPRAHFSGEVPNGPAIRVMSALNIKNSHFGSSSTLYMSTGTDWIIPMLQERTIFGPPPLISPFHPDPLLFTPSFTDVTGVTVKLDMAPFAKNVGTNVSIGWYFKFSSIWGPSGGEDLTTPSSREPLTTPRWGSPPYRSEPNYSNDFSLQNSSSFGNFGGGSMGSWSSDGGGSSGSCNFGGCIGWNGN